MSRFNAEQDFILEEMLQALLKEPKLPFELWEEALPHLHDLWKTCGKGRGAEKNVDTWRIACLRLVEKALSLSLSRSLSLWQDSFKPSPACSFGFEVGGKIIQLPSLFVKVLTKNVACDAATRWVFGNKDVLVCTSQFVGGFSHKESDICGGIPSPISIFGGEPVESWKAKLTRVAVNNIFAHMESGGNSRAREVGADLAPCCGVNRDGRTSYT